MNVRRAINAQGFTESRNATIRINMVRGRLKRLSMAKNMIMPPGDILGSPRGEKEVV